jgi:hypothetical protein
VTTATQNDTAEILAFIQGRGMTGSTAREAASALGFDPNTVSARLVRLKGRGEVQATNEKRGGGTVHFASSTGLNFSHPAKGAKPKGKKARPPKASKPTSPATKLKNHFVLVLDHSGSMDFHKRGALELLNKQIAEIQAASDQQNTITIYGIGQLHDTHVEEKQFNVPAHLTSPAQSYVAGCGTPLFRGVLAAARRAMVSGDAETSFVVLVLTDGEDTEPDQTRERELRTLIAEKQATDRWTFAFLVPPGHYKKALVSRLGIPEGNVQEWSDAKKAAADTQVSTQSYFNTRRSGATSSVSYFQPNATSIDVRKLRDVTDEVKILTAAEEWNRDNDYIRGFVNGKTRGQFSPGRSFFELNKREKRIEAYKACMIRDRSTGRIYADGPTTRVRDELGFPKTGAISVEPGNHGNYDVLVQSMSTNRIIPRGTKLAFWHGAV